jgi:hypothetical protein
LPDGIVARFAESNVLWQKNSELSLMTHYPIASPLHFFIEFAAPVVLG